MLENRNWLKNREQTHNSTQFDFNPKEEEIFTESNEEEIKKTDVNFARVKGRIIHRILSEEIAKAEIITKVKMYLKNMIDEKEWQSNQFTYLKHDIITDLNNYFKSENYFCLKELTDYRNEFEVYHQHDDYYLYGIIDKLIVDNEKIVIIDFKTDSIRLDEIPGRASQYFTQLKFYSYITNKLFRGISNLEIRIVFLKHPDKFLTMNIVTKDLVKIEQEIEFMVKKVRERMYGKNLQHCNHCVFSIQNNCIVV